jgi:mRNA interferase HigB
MHIISRSRLSNYWRTHPDAETSLRSWYKQTNSAKWQNLAELRQNFPSADLVGNLTIFNIKGNSYRLITLVDYKFQKVFIRHVLTHADYDKEGWKNDEWFTTS